MNDHVTISDDHLTVDVPVNDQTLFDLFITACEGGINYWCYFDEYKWTKPGSHPRESVEERQDLQGFRAVIGLNNPDDYEEGTDLVIDRAVIIKGLAAAFNSPSGANYVRQGIRDCVLDPENADFDAEVADIVVQMGLFGEVMYG